MRISPSHLTSRKKVSCGASDKLRKQVAVERQQLHRLFESYRPLLEKSTASPPSDIELSALAAMLHSFYIGIENIFKRAAGELGDPMPGEESWHQDLDHGRGYEAQEAAHLAWVAWPTERIHGISPLLPPRLRFQP